MDNDNEQLANPPITEALIHFNCLPPENFDLSQLKQVCEVLKDDYPLITERYNANITFEDKTHNVRKGDGGI
jgi:uncharacterized protein (TIGR04255 family)